jgi:hypothetical protein
MKPLVDAAIQKGRMGVTNPSLYLQWEGCSGGWGELCGRLKRKGQVYKHLCMCVCRLGRNWGGPIGANSPYTEQSQETRSLHFSWELVRRAESWALPQFHCIWTCTLTKSPGEGLHVTSEKPSSERGYVSRTQSSKEKKGSWTLPLHLVSFPRSLHTAWNEWRSDSMLCVHAHTSHMWVNIVGSWSGLLSPYLVCSLFMTLPVPRTRPLTHVSISQGKVMTYLSPISR